MRVAGNLTVDASVAATDNISASGNISATGSVSAGTAGISTTGAVDATGLLQTSTGVKFPDNSIQTIAIPLPPIRWAVQGNAQVTTLPVIETMIDFAGTVSEIQFYTDTLPQGTGGQGLQIDVQINGTSIFTTKPIILNGSTHNTPVTAYAPSGGIYITSNTTSGASTLTPTYGQNIGQINSGANTFSKGAVISLLITQVGSTTPGGNSLLVNVRF